jgi:hypothetical protein
MKFDNHKELIQTLKDQDKALSADINVTADDCMKSLGVINYAWIWFQLCVVEFVLALYHEGWHLMFAYPLYWTGFIKKPTFVHNSWGKFEIDWHGNTTSSTSNAMYINIKDQMEDQLVRYALLGWISIAPAFGFVLLLIISPWWLYPVYILNMRTLWLSPSDVVGVIRGYRALKLIYKTIKS